MSSVLQVLKCKCPNCKKGNIFSNLGNLLFFRAPKMNNTCNTCNFKFEKAEWYVSAEYKIKEFFKSKHFEKVIYIVLSITLGWVLKHCFDKWI